MSRSNGLVAALVLGAIAVVSAVVVLTASPRPSALPAPTSAASPIANATVAPSGSPAPAQVSPSPTARGAHENLILGYRITLPDGYRRFLARLNTTGGDALGDDFYTTRTEQEEREACRQDIGHLPTFRDPPDIGIAAWRNPGGLSPREWATTPRQPGGFVMSTHQKVEPTTIGGQEAVRLVQDNATAATSAFVVRGGDRMYEIRPAQLGSTLVPTWLDDVARTFVVIAPQPFPSATPSAAPQVGVEQVSQQLAGAFAAKDANAVRRLMPECHFSFVYAIDGEVPGQGGNNRSVFLFSPLLHERFTAGTLSVTVDPVVQQRTRGTGVEYFVRSQWREPDRLVPIDLVLAERDGRWLWLSAIHYYSSAQLGQASCVPYRSPWVSGTGGC